jgi:hypothetical protein
VVVEDMRMNLECMRDDRWSKEDAQVHAGTLVVPAGTSVGDFVAAQVAKIMQGNPNTDNARYYGTANPNSLGTTRSGTRASSAETRWTATHASRLSTRRHRHSCMRSPAAPLRSDDRRGMAP